MDIVQRRSESERTVISSSRTMFEVLIKPPRFIRVSAGGKIVIMLVIKNKVLQQNVEKGFSSVNQKCCEQTVLPTTSFGRNSYGSCY